MKTKICAFFVHWYDLDGKVVSFTSHDPLHVAMIVEDILKHNGCNEIDIFVPKDCDECPVETCCRKENENES